MISFPAAGAASAFAFFVLVSAPFGAHAAAAYAEPLSPLNASVAGGESRDFSVRFTDSLGQPAAGVSATFANDACGWFTNGSSTIATTTDAAGVASAHFTAYSQGITCTVAAYSGSAQASFAVLTYLPSQAYLAAVMPSRVFPGLPFTLRASAMYGAYPLYDVPISARIVAGSANASVTPDSASSGQDGAISFTVTPSATPGDFQVELQFRDRVQRFAATTAVAPWQDMWWAGPQEDGWGMSVVQHADTLFSVIYAYDASGAPTWYVMPGGSWDAAHRAYSGALYSPRGAPYSSYDPARFVPGAPVGSTTLDFSDPAQVAMSYTIGGTAGAKSLEREQFGAPLSALTPSDGDMWWGGASQNGWGLAVLQQYSTLFGVWFTYDEAGAPTWLVMPAGTWTDAQAWQGTLYRTSSSPWLGHSYDKTALRTTSAGTMRITFGASAAHLDIVVDGHSYSAPIERQPF